MLAWQVEQLICCGLEWCEIDIPVDMTRAEDMVLGWSRQAMAQ